MTDLGTVAPDGERRRLRFERFYDAPPEELWSALTEPERLARWLAPGEIGETVRLEFEDDNVVTGRVLAFEPPRVLEYEWHYPGEDESVVRFELSPAESGGTVLVLEHRLLNEAQSIGYAAGWHAHLDVLDGAPSWNERFEELLPRYSEASASISASDLPRDRAIRS
jgi:uncharacterized protein YndB with AHSA1/START domain